MRNRIVSSSDLVGLPAIFPTTETLCAIQHNCSYVEYPVSLFGPERYESRYQYPLLVWLHSNDSSEGELENVMCALSIQNYVGCAPRGPIASGRASGRFTWGGSESAFGLAEEIVFGAIDLASEQFSIDRRRVFLAGFGSGATAALRIALRYPEQFAGVASVCGRFPSEQGTLVNLQQARTLPMLWLYGEQSGQCGIRQVCEQLPVIHSAGLGVDIRQYPCGDELLSNMLTDTNSWMMQLVTGQPIVSLLSREPDFSKN